MKEAKRKATKKCWMKWVSERSASRKLWWGLSSHMGMQGHVCGDVFDMCWAHRGVVWLKPRQQMQPKGDLHCCRPPVLQSSAQLYNAVTMSTWETQDINRPLFAGLMKRCMFLCFVWIWLTIPAMVWSAQETWSKSWACLVRGDALAFLNKREVGTTVRMSTLTNIHAIHVQKYVFKRVCVLIFGLMQNFVDSRLWCHLKVFL